MTAIKTDIEIAQEAKMLHIREVAEKLGIAEGEDLGDGVVGEVKLADDTPDAGLNHSNDKDEAKAAKPPVINTKEGKELTDGIHKMWQSITGNRNN